MTFLWSLTNPSKHLLQIAGPTILHEQHMTVFQLFFLVLRVNAKGYPVVFQALDIALMPVCKKLIYIVN